MGMVRAFVLDLIYEARPIDQGKRGLNWAGVLLCLVLFGLGFRLGADVFLQNLNIASFYQDNHGPAVSFACTGRMDLLSGPESVDRFLRLQDWRLESCEGVDEARTPAWRAYDAGAIVLYALAALSWRLFGFEWSSLFAVAGLFAGLFAVGAYLFVRCFSASRALAFGLAVWALHSGPVTDYMMHLRDFAKAPLIVLGLAAMGYAVTHALGLRGALLAAAVVGLLMGIGKGIRADVIMLAPIAALVFLMLWRGAPTLRARILQPLMAIGVMAGAYFVGAAPIDLINAGKPDAPSLMAHVLILGFAETFYHTLSFAPGNYSVFREYVDEHVVTLVNLFHNGAGQYTLSGQEIEYDAPASRMLTLMFLSFPHDTFMRVFQTANYIGYFSINNLVYGPATVIILALAALGPLWRQPAFFILSVGVLVGTLSLQVHPRHAFYVVVFGAALFGLAGTLLVELGRAIATARRKRRVNLRPLGLQACVLAAASGACLALIWGAERLAWSAQSSFLRDQVETYRHQTWAPAPIERTGTSIVFPSFIGEEDGTVNLLAVDFTFVIPDDQIVGLAGPSLTSRFGAEITSASPVVVMSNGQRGYQVFSRLIRREELEAAGAADGRLNVLIAGRTRAWGWHIGALSADESRWISSTTLPQGSFEETLAIVIPEGEPGVFIVFERANSGATRLTIDSLELRAAGVAGPCEAQAWAASTAYQRRTGVYPFSPQQVTPSETATYYFPIALTFADHYFRSLELTGAPPECVTGARIARGLPPGVLPVELIEQEGEIQVSERGRWAIFWRDFWRWYRRPNY